MLKYLEIETYLNNVTNSKLNIKWWFGLKKIQSKKYFIGLTEVMIIYIIFFFTFSFFIRDKDYLNLIMIFALVIFFTPLPDEISLIILVIKNFVPKGFDRNYEIERKSKIHNDQATMFVFLAVPISIVIIIAFFFLFSNSTLKFDVFWAQVAFFPVAGLFILIQILPNIRHPDEFWNYYCYFTLNKYKKPKLESS